MSATARTGWARRFGRPPGDEPIDEREARASDRRILAGSLAVAAALWGVAALQGIGLLSIRLGPGEAGGPGPVLDFVVLGLLLALAPYGVARAVHLRRVEQLERRLPEFLEDVAEAGRSGLTLSASIRVSARGHYGRLTPEIRRVAAQLDWGVPVSEALAEFEGRVPTPLVRQAIAIVLRAQTTGGPYPEVLLRVAHDTRAAHIALDRRKSAMATYVSVIYLSFFVFLLTIYVLAAVFIPQMLAANPGAGAAVGPWVLGAGVAGSLVLAFFVAVLIHALGDGVLSGLLYRGRWVDGLPHAAILLATGWVVLRFVVPPIGGGGG